MRKDFLSFSPPAIGPEEIEEVSDTLRSQWLTTGPKVGRFERELAQFLGAPAALALNSCTAGLHLALVTLGIGPGDAVITTPMTFCASVNVIEHVGARPILVDVEPDTLNLSPHRVAEALAQTHHENVGRVKALLPVHLYGHPCEMDALLGLAREHGLYLIEDAAHALPAKYKGRSIGTIGDLTAFSFYATKNLTTAEGGMLTGAPEWLERARILSLHGMNRDAWKRYSAEGSWYYEVVAPGFKYNMTDIQAAIGLQQLRKLPHFQKRRRAIVQRYQEAFSSLDTLQLPVERPEVEHAWHVYAIRLNLEQLRISRGQFIEELKMRNIGSSVHFIPIHLHPYYREKYGYRPKDFPVAYDAYQRLVSLPLSPALSDQDVTDVIEAVNDILTRFQR
jgi:dTDP-4-amino-4,6-dideoxygalactose transaminase